MTTTVQFMEKRSESINESTLDNVQVHGRKSTNP